MEFGKLEDISKVNWTLPPVDGERMKKEILDQNILMGSPAWGCKHWLGKIYPEKTSADDFLYHYSRRFNCIELNTSHYRTPDETTTKSWVSQVPEGFVFCPKVHKDISHDKSGLVDRGALKYHLGFLENLGSNLGSSFIQFHENFSYSDKYLLFKFLENWPSEFKLSVELRHPSWYQEQRLLAPLADYLHKKGMSAVITDVSGRRDILHSTLTTDWVMIRLIGNDLDLSDESRLQDWSQRFLVWRSMGIRTVYLFIHQPDDVFTIEFAQMAEKILKMHGHQRIPNFDFIKPLDLFSFL